MKNALATLFALAVIVGCSAQTQINSIQANTASAGVVGGSVVSATSPFAKSTVVIVRPHGKNTSFCSGTILTNDLIITAAHCFGVERGTDDASDAYVYFGNFNPKSYDKDLLRPIVAHRRHPQYAGFANGLYDSSYVLNDVALAKIDLETLPEGFAAASLLADASVLKPKTPVVIAGFGPQTLRKPQFILRSLQGKLKSGIDPTSGQVLLSFDGRQSPSHGDSGGPAYIMAEGKMALFGVDSTQDGYEPIPRHLEWIKSAARDLQNSAN